MREVTIPWIVDTKSEKRLELVKFCFCHDCDYTEDLFMMKIIYVLKTRLACLNAARHSVLDFDDLVSEAVGIFLGKAVSLHSEDHVVV